MVVLASAALAVGGFVVIAGTVKMFMWAGVEGAIVYWGVLVVAIIALIHGMSQRPTQTEPATTAWKGWWRVARVRVSAQLHTPRRPPR